LPGSDANLGVIFRVANSLGPRVAIKSFNFRTSAQQCFVVLVEGRGPVSVVDSGEGVMAAEKLAEVGKSLGLQGNSLMSWIGEQQEIERTRKGQMLLVKGMVAVAKAMGEIKVAAADKPSLNSTFTTMAEGFAIMATSNKINLKRQDYVCADLAPS
jgi:hypothetical protein